MKLPRRQLLQSAGTVIAAFAVGQIANAQDYPTRPVRVIVPYAPGGVTDTFARILSQKLSERLGKQFYVENITGGSGNIGTGQAARATPDGYTLLVAFSSFVVNPTLFDKLPFDPIKDFEPITLAVSSTTVLVIHPAVPAESVKTLVELIKQNPGKYSFASAGTGTQAHLAGEQFRLLLGLDLVHVPFNGGAPAAASVIAGHTPIGFTSPTSVMQHVKDGTVRALAVTSNVRSQTMPDVETMTEAGYRDINGDSWVGLLAPAGTPKEIVSRLYREVVAILALADVRERLLTLGDDPVASTPDEFAQRIKDEIRVWADIIRRANIKPQ
jgi:tripartite-type tricarboxylate transporter receptor subunit TctC